MTKFIISYKKFEVNTGENFFMAIKIFLKKWIWKYMHIKDFPICCKFFCKMQLRNTENSVKSWWNITAFNWFRWVMLIKVYNVLKTFSVMYCNPGFFFTVFVSQNIFFVKSREPFLSVVQFCQELFPIVISSHPELSFFGIPFILFNVVSRNFLQVNGKSAVNISII